MTNELITEQEKAQVLRDNIKNTKMGVSMADFKFPPIDGIQQKVTLVCNRTGTFMNIGFKQDVENTLTGNIADHLLKTRPDMFTVKKVNGRNFRDLRNELSNEDANYEKFLERMKKDFEIAPKKVSDDKKDIKRDRKEESSKITSNFK